MLPPSPRLKYLSHRDELGTLLASWGLKTKLAEVGTFHGAHAAVLLRNFPGRVFCVDPWKNQPEAVYFDGANKVKMDDVYAGAVKSIGQNPRCTLLRMFSAEGVKQFRDGELDCVYLDGNHALPNIREDIALWWPKVRIGGIVAGHDFFTRYDRDTNSDAQTAVMELAEKIGQWPHVTWCSSWYFVKTAEADAAFRGVPYVPPKPIDRSRTPLVAVLAVARPDFHLAKQWLRWVAKLDDGFPLVVYMTKALSEDQRNELMLAADGFNSHIDFATTPELFEQGYAPSANYMFRTALEHVEAQYPGHAMLWCEADTVPMCANWFDKIAAEYRACGKPFMGDLVTHAPGRRDAIDHMTGVAVYPPDWRDLAPSFAVLPQPRPEQGWDSACAHETVPQMAKAKTIQQVWRPPAITAEWVARNIRPETALFHQCKDGTLINVLAQAQGLDPIPLDAPLCEPTYPKPVFVMPTGSADPGAPRTEILIVTFKRDMEFLRYALRSIRTYATGFAGVTVLAPEHERGLYDWIKRDATVRYFAETPGKGMLSHEIQKCRADEWCPNADFVLHMDADCMFFRPVSARDYFTAGRALSIRESYATIKNPNRHLWKKAVNAAIGREPDHDYMLRHPQIHFRDVYSIARARTEEFTGMGFDSYVLSCRNEFPQGFAELPLLGTVAALDFAGYYDFRDYDRRADAEFAGTSEDSFQYVYRRDRDFMVEWWSHGGIAKYKSDCEAVLAGRIPAYWVK